MSDSSSALGTVGTLELLIINNFKQVINDSSALVEEFSGVSTAGEKLIETFGTAIAEFENFGRAGKQAGVEAGEGAAVAVEGWDLLTAQITAATVAEREFRQEALVAAEPVLPANGLTMTLEEARNVLEVTKAGNVTIVQMAREMVAAADAEVAAIDKVTAAFVKQGEAAATAQIKANLARGMAAELYQNAPGATTEGLTIAQMEAMSAAHARASTAVGVNTRALAEENTALAANNVELETNAVAAGAAGVGHDAMTASLGNARYALNGAATALGTWGAGLLAIPVLSAAIASDYQRDFANVERATLQPLGAANALKQSLINLTTQVPETFKALTQIATAGAQLGIPESGLLQFTSVVAKLTTTTQISAVAAENLFQKFYVLAGVKPDNFGNLASAILNVSIHTGAAEAQISLLATRIIGVAQQAGFTVPQVIALSAAFGSISAQSASYQMGTIIRLVGNMQTAVEGGTPALKAFAETAGLTEKQVTEAFGTPKFATYFEQFIGGLDKTQKSGGDVLAILDEMGIKSNRDRGAILNLADAHQVFTNALKLSTDGYANAAILNQHFQKVNETLKSQVTEMTSTFGALGNQLGSLSTGPLTDMVDKIIAATKAFGEFEATPFGQTATTLTVGAAAIVGSFLLIAAGAAKITAAVIAVKDATEVPIKLIDAAFVRMTVSASAAAAAAEADAIVNAQAAIALEAVGFEASAAALAYGELAVAETAAGDAAAPTLGTFSKLGAVLSSMATGSVLGIVTAASLGVVAVGALGAILTSVAIQVDKNQVTQDGLTTSAAKYGDQIKKNIISIQDYATVLGKSEISLNVNDNLSGDINKGNIDKAFSTAPAEQVILSYQKLLLAGKQVKDSTQDIADKFPLATKAYQDAIASNLGLVDASKQAAEGIHNVATAGLQLAIDFGGIKNVKAMEDAFQKSTSSYTSMGSVISEAQKGLSAGAQAEADSVNANAKSNASATKDSAASAYNASIASAQQTEAAQKSTAATFTSKVASEQGKVAAEEQYKAAEAAARATKAATDAQPKNGSASTKDFYDGASLSLAQYTAQLAQNTVSATTWSTNLKTVTLQYGSDVANQFIATGANATTQSLLAQLVRATPEQGKSYKDAVLANLAATNGAVAQQQLAAADIFNSNGTDIGAEEAKFITSALASGVDFRDIAAKWHIQLGAALKDHPPTIKVKVDLSQAQKSFNAFYLTASTTALNVPISLARPGTVGGIAPSVPFSASADDPWFAEGGYTGDGSKYQPAGVVHAGEFVFSAAATRNIGVENLAFSHNMAKNGYAEGGYVAGGAVGTNTNIMQWSPADRQLLIDIRTAVASGFVLAPTALQSSIRASDQNSSNRRVN